MPPTRLAVPLDLFEDVLAAEEVDAGVIDYNNANGGTADRRATNGVFTHP
jgi:hypothetical protein